MGVLPLVFQNGQNAEGLGLNGTETISIEGVDANIQPRQSLTVRAKKADGTETTFQVTARLDTPVDVHYFKHGGILQAVLRNLMKA